MRKLLYMIWPPHEANHAHAIMDLRNCGDGEDARWNGVLERVRKTVSEKNDESGAIEEMAKEIQESETKRKEVLENKAAAFFGGLGVAISVLSIIPAVFATGGRMTPLVSPVVGVAYLLAQIHLLVAVAYSIKVRKIGVFRRPCAENLLDMLREGRDNISERITIRIAQVKWNEDVLIRKANYIHAVEKLFLRGLSLIAFGAVVSVLGEIGKMLGWL
ncbi:MAG: hypothetical protein P9L99_19970 [Candidatus Lernaella stagnicola]|nr:hypothetical protein [Candidatus Lernaella stagnicola]